MKSGGRHDAVRAERTLHTSVLRWHSLPPAERVRSHRVRRLLIAALIEGKRCNRAKTVNSATHPTPARATREQHFVRVLFILDRAGAPVGQHAPEGACRLMRGQVRLQALDFWMRNPDYLADELLDVYDDDHGQTWALDTAKAIFDDREPAIRRLPMAKWRFGAYERLDDTLSILTSRRLLVHQPEAGPVSVREHLYWLTHRGHEAAEALLAADAIFEWYAGRADLVARLAAGRGGTALKERQYQQAEYRETSPSALIAPIEPRVRKRLAELTGGTP